MHAPRSGMSAPEPSQGRTRLSIVRNEYPDPACTGEMEGGGGGGAGKGRQISKKSCKNTSKDDGMC